MIVALVVVVVVAAVVVLVNLRLRADLPTRVARRKLDAQLAKLERQLASASIADHEYVAAQEALVRQQWVNTQMDRTPIDTLDIPGMGPSMHKALRTHGITSLRDLASLGRVKIRNIGAARSKQLLAGYRHECRRLANEAAALDRAALDALTQGRLSVAIAQHEAEELQRRRDSELLRIQIQEILRRRTQLAAAGREPARR
jgi:predicted flap endonuclease-1-like 5' DNA nuclease